MKVAIITGITGQDGSYMAELLLTKGYRVIGAVRDGQKAKLTLSSALLSGAELVQWNMRDQPRMTEVLAEFRPSEVYNFAAYSSGAGMFDEPVEIGEVNGIAVARILEAIRAVDINIRFCQASSSELFGDAVESPQTESTPFRPRTPYGAAKLYAHWMIQTYRKKYGLFACSAILFNHESPRRGLGFVTRKISHEAAKIKLGLSNVLHLGNLDARRDWGFAGDSVRAMWMMLQQPRADDYVLATGETHSVRDWCNVAFAHLGLDYRDYVREDVASFRPNESIQLVGNSDKARKQLGWLNDVGFRELICMMVDADLQLLKNKFL
jgi:GDPmannose 4,6-dehydratase